MTAQVGGSAARKEALAAAALAAGTAAVLAAGAHAGALPLLVAVAAVQAAVALAWAFGGAVPGRAGALVIAALAAGGADLSVSLYPHARLEPLLPVAGLVIPAMFVHQLARRSRRVAVTASLGQISVLVCLEIAPAALLQLRAEFQADAAGAAAVTAVAVAGGAALVVAAVVDPLLPVARFDVGVPRGLPALVGGTAVGAATGYLALHHGAGISAGGAALAGAVIGAVAGLLGVAAAFLGSGAGVGTVARAAPLAALLPMSLVAPPGLLLLLAVRR